VSKFLVDALKYASRGFAVFPCGGSNGKKPLTPHGFKDASTDPKQIEEWWTTHPNANIAIATGEMSGLVVLDIDNKNGKDGSSTLLELEKQHGTLPPTLQQSTPSGGYHLFFQYPGTKTKSRTDIREGLDSRADGGYVVAAPSISPAVGTYVWKDPEAAIAEPPEWLISLINDHGKARTESVASTPISRDERRRIEAALKYVDPDLQDEWRNMGMALHDWSPSSEAYDVWTAWSRSSHKFNERDQRKAWERFNSERVNGERVTLGTLFYHAKAGGYIPSDHDSDELHSLVREMNKEWFVVIENGKVFVCRDQAKCEPANTELEYFATEEFHKALANKTQTIGGKKQKLSRLWFDHPSRREYPFGTICDPTEKADPRFFNTWRGFAVNPSADDPSAMVQHIDDVLSGGHPDFAAYIKGWLAVAVQRPGQLAGTVLVLRGRQGTGKGLLGTAMLHIFGHHSQHIVQAEHLVGRFQSHLENCLFLFADEAFFPGDPKIKGQLKSLITEPQLTFEPKYRPPKVAENRLSILMASNEDFVVPAETDDRRFAVFDVSSDYQNNTGYFDALWKFVSGPELGGFLRFLQEYDISNFNIRCIPATVAKTEQKLQMLNTGERFCYWALQRGSFASEFCRTRGNYVSGAGYEEYLDDWIEHLEGWHQFRTTQILYACYEEWHKNERSRQRKLDLANFSKVLNKFAKPKRPRSTEVINLGGWMGERARGYQFGNLDEARARFLKGLNLPGIVWEDPHAVLVRLEREVPF